MGKWHDIEKNPHDVPIPGERVIICISGGFVGEGYLKDDGCWYRYCDFEPIENHMSGKVEAWMEMPKPFRRGKAGNTG